MSWSFNAGNRYHTQDTSYYCGAACAMMILHEIGVPYADLDQDDLYASNHSHNSQPGWATDPHGLCYTLNDRRPAAFLPRYFLVNKRLTEAEGSRDVAFTLFHYRVSAAVLVYHCQHWNVVCGVQTDVDPATGPYVIEGFWLNNPVWDASVASHDGVDSCGSGGVHGVANEFVTYAEWQTNRFNGCAYDAPAGAQQWISVCDPEPATFGLPHRRESRRKGDGRRLIAGKEIVRLAESGLKEYGIAASEWGREMLSEGGFGTPLLVKRLDDPNDYYYLTPWQHDGGIRGFVDNDARFGMFKSVRLFAQPIQDLLISAAPGAALLDAVGRRVNNKQFSLPEERGRFRVYPGTYCVPPLLVWKPCRESWSPHLPFYQLVIGGNVVYVRIDGAVFTQLTGGRGV